MELKTCKFSLDSSNEKLHLLKFIEVTSNKSHIATKQCASSDPFEI